MQTPDADGYVTVKWPSKNVPHGGIFHPRISESSTNTQQYLKLLLDESKFNIKLRQTRGFGLRCKDEEPARRQASAPPIPLVRPRTSRRRSLSAIRSSGIYEEEEYCPLKRGEDREKLKDRLANTMAYGDSPEQQQQQKLRLSPRQRKQKPKLPTKKEQWNDLVTQIRERAEWLAEMEWLGEAAEHRDIVQGQIAERMRALDALGVDSLPSSTRSAASNVPSRCSTLGTARSAAESVRNSAHPDSYRSTISTTSGTVKKAGTKKVSSRKKPIEENVAEYTPILTPLRYSPRRRL